MKFINSVLSGGVMSSQIKKIATSAVFIFLFHTASINAGQLSISNEVQENVRVLTETKNCPGCDLKGAVLNRLELEGANLEGANLSRAKLFLANLANANLKNTNLSEAEFGGADLANADLRGANLTAVSFAGAYMVGTLLDGEMISTKPYVDSDISAVEEDVYVEDTVKPKINPSTEDINIGSRRDFEETSQEVIVESPKPDSTKEDVIVTEPSEKELPPTVEIVQEEILVEEQIEGNVPEVSANSPGPKAVPAFQSVQLAEKADDTLETSVVAKEDQDVDAVFEASHNSEAAVSVSQNPVTTSYEDRDSLGLVQENEPAQEDAAGGQSERIDDGKMDSDIGLGKEPAEEDIKTTSVTNPSGATGQSDVLAEEDYPSVTGERENTVVHHDTADTEANSVVEEADNVRIETPSENAVVNADSQQEGQEEAETQLTGDLETVQEAAKTVPAIEELKTLSKDVYANMERLLDDNSCYGCDLTDANLSGESLDSADLEGAILINAILSGADLEQANLKGADLRGANLRDADLSEADLYKANLSGADLTGAKLEDALLDDADLNGVKGYLPAIPLFPGQ